jgi:hypothetical protein
MVHLHQPVAIKKRGLIEMGEAARDEGRRQLCAHLGRSKALVGCQKAEVAPLFGK